MHISFAAAVPQPPVAAIAPHSWATAALIAIVVIDAGLLAWAARRWQVSKRPLLLVCLIGGMASNIVEAPLDTLLMCYFPGHGQPIAYTTFDRPIPVWAMLCYPILFGVVPYLFYKVFESGAGIRTFWKVALAGFGLNMIMEFSLLRTGIYMYYGEQPFRVLGFPLYWTVVNVGASVCVACIAYQLRGFWRGWRWIVLIVAFPSCQLGFLAFVGWPLASVLNTSAGLVWTMTAGVVTLSLGLGVMHVLASLCVPGGRWQLRRIPAGERTTALQSQS